MPPRLLSTYYEVLLQHHLQHVSIARIGSQNGAADGLQGMGQPEVAIVCSDYGPPGKAAPRECLW